MLTCLSFIYNFKKDSYAHSPCLFLVKYTGNGKSQEEINQKIKNIAEKNSGKYLQNVQVRAKKESEEKLAKGIKANKYIRSWKTGRKSVRVAR